MTDVAVLRRVVPELEEAEARRLLSASGGDLKAAMSLVLQQQQPPPAPAPPSQPKL